MALVMIEGYMCERCLYRWSPRTGTGIRMKTEPTFCPSCKSPYWNKPRKIDLPPEKRAALWEETHGARNAA